MSDKKNPEAATSGLTENDVVDTVTASGIDSTTPDTSSTTPKTYLYQDIEPLYRDLAPVLPIPAGAKNPPPTGYTGRTPKKLVDDDARAAWATHDGNFALKMPEEYLVLDVDDYTSDDGHVHEGAATLDDLVERLGELPDGPLSTRRADTVDPRRSGHRWYRLPADVVGAKWQGSAGPGIDVVQGGHRYAMVWPSVVDGMTYRWYSADATPMDRVPTAEDIPELPRPWVNHLLKSRTGGKKRKKGSGPVAPASREITDDIEAAMMTDDREPCDVVRDRVARALSDFHTAAEGGRHDTMLFCSLMVVIPCVYGHSGYAWAIEQLAEAWADSVGDDRDDEFADMVTGAVAKLAAEAEIETWSPITPHHCVGISDTVPLDGSETPYSEAVTEHIQAHPDTDPAIVDDRKAIDRALPRKELSEAELKAGADPESAPVIKCDESYDMVMANDPDLRHLYYDRLLDTMCWDEVPSWRNPLANKSSGFRLLTDVDLVHIKRRLTHSVAQTSKDMVMEIIIIYANHPARQSNPFTAYIDSLVWDGVPRLGDGPVKAISTMEDTPYTRAALRNGYLGIITRAFEPGCQLDSMLVFVGGQGVRKTSFFRSIAEGIPRVHPYTILTDVPGGINAKDINAQRHRTPIVIFDEIDQLRSLKAQSAMKGDLSMTEDEWRPPYGHFVTTHARAFAMFGTTNDENFLDDETGARRYWPIRILDVIPTQELDREYQDQLLAEARHLYLAGERPRYDQAFEDLANAYRSAMTYDPVATALADFFESPVRDGRSVDINKLTTKFIIDAAELKAPDFGISLRMLQSKIRAYMDGREDYEKKRSVRVPGRSPQAGWVATEHKDVPDPVGVAAFGISPTPQSAASTASGTVTTRGGGRSHAIPDPLPAPVAPKPLNTVEYDG